MPKHFAVLVPLREHYAFAPLREILVSANRGDHKTLFVPQQQGPLAENIRNISGFSRTPCGNKRHTCGNIRQAVPGNLPPLSQVEM